jgi:hypothetical protein
MHSPSRIQTLKFIKISAGYVATGLGQLYQLQSQIDICFLTPLFCEQRLLVVKEGCSAAVLFGILNVFYPQNLSLVQFSFRFGTIGWTTRMVIDFGWF